METSQVVLLVLLAALVALVLGMVLGWLLARSRTPGSHAPEVAERVGSALEPVRATLDRMERQVRDLERDRVEQFGEVGARLRDVAGQTESLRLQTVTLTGALRASDQRGTWGEAQLRRILEHAGMLARCDFDEQVAAVSAHDARVRPDVVVRLPGEKVLVIDAKAPMGAFLQAQREDLPPDERDAHLDRHAAALRRHVDELAGKAYWSAFTHSPELVVCFVPSDALLAAALRSQPDLYDHGQSRGVVLASPAVLLAVLRALALAWQQDALSRNAQELLALGSDLHRRLGTLGRHVGSLGASLRRSVEAYNAMVGTLESRVLVTSRRMHDLDLVREPVAGPDPVTVTPRPLTAAELLDTGLGDTTLIDTGLTDRELLDAELREAGGERPLLLEEHRRQEGHRHPPGRGAEGPRAGSAG